MDPELRKRKTVRQRVNRVLCFSSQYGSDRSDSYTAENRAVHGENIQGLEPFSMVSIMHIYVKSHPKVDEIFWRGFGNHF